MVEFASPVAGLLQGAQQGFGIGQQIAQNRQMKRQREWENDYRKISSVLDMASRPGVSPESSAKMLNGISQTWERWSGTPMPELTPESFGDFKPILKNISKLGEQVAAGKMPIDVAFREANSQIATYASSRTNFTEGQKAAIEAVMAPLESEYKQSQKVNLIDERSRIYRERLKTYSPSQLNQLRSQIAKQLEVVIMGSPEEMDLKSKLIGIDEQIDRLRGLKDKENSDLKERAKRWLEQNGAPATPANIDAAIKAGKVK